MNRTRRDAPVPRSAAAYPGAALFVTQAHNASLRPRGVTEGVLFATPL